MCVSSSIDRLFVVGFLVPFLEIEGTFAGKIQITLRKTNIAPENKPFQKESRLPIINFEGYVGFRKCNWRKSTCFLFSDLGRH